MQTLGTNRAALGPIRPVSPQQRPKDVEISDWKNAKSIRKKAAEKESENRDYQEAVVDGKRKYIMLEQLSDGAHLTYPSGPNYFPA